jgi:hypothetical protein
MWVFVWKATEDTPSRSTAHMCLEDAWDSFKHLTVDQLPDHIFTFMDDPYAVSFMEWNDFMIHCRETKLMDHVKS